MDRHQAALNPKAADRWAQDRVAEKLLDEPKPEQMEMPDEDGIIRSRQRRAFLGLANEIKSEAAVEAMKRDEFARKVWGQ